MSDPTYAWRFSDLEGLRTALRLPVLPASIRAINDQMAWLEQHYPDAIPAAKGHIDAIALIDNPPPGEPGPSSPSDPVIRKVTRKGAAVPIPAELPRKKLDVVEYATDLLMEEVSTEYAIPSDGTVAIGSSAQAQRRSHVDALLLIFPGLSSWQVQQVPSFGGQMIRG